ncbi:MAG: AAA family ATPase [Polyangiaceae bacterium]|jgi:tetratricopeptide (TPR) repeat protein
MTTVGQNQAASAAPNEIGIVLAQRYEVVREIGRGGMGVVYLCKDVVTGDRVALKRLRSPEKGGARAAEESWWFHQEARAVSLLDHPAIVRARDFGQLADGSPFFVMDVLPGRSVHEWMHTMHLPWSVIWAMVDQALAALAHAHARGVIHGDLKPSNIMLDLASGALGPRAYVLDLGLAWLREYRHDSRLDGATAPEVAVHSGAGTVGWVAPEQIRRQVALVGPATDLYALGCVMYRVMSGKEVFEGAAQDVLRAHKRSAVPAPRLPDDVPTKAAAFVLTLLEKKPWNRYEFAADARAAWAELRPPHAFTLEDIVQGHASSRAAPAAYARSLAPGILTLRGPMLVARQEERRDLWDLVKLAASGKRPQELVALIGEAGVGKSRLAEWLCAEAHERGAMLPLRARYGRTPSPLDGITGAINAHYGLTRADRTTVEQTLMARWDIAADEEEALAWVSATAEWLRPTPPGVLVPLGPTGKRFVLDRPELRFLVIKRLLERLAADRPILLWLDDFHYASPNTFEVVTRLKRDAPDLRILILATARSETLATDLDAALRMEAVRAAWSGRVLELKPLSTDDTETLLRSALPLEDGAIRRAVEQSRGNPLFALQLLYAWAGGGYLTLDGDKYRVPDDALHGRPITTAELWDERVRAIPTELRLSAYAAAALGDDVRGDVLRMLCASLGMDPRDALVALTRAQILLAAGNDQFHWPHALLQEHLIERLHERKDAPAVYRLAANALSKHPAVGSRRIMKHRVSNLLRAGDDDTAAKLMFDFIRASWRRGRDTAATLRDLEMFQGRLHASNSAEAALWRAESLRYMGRLDEARAEAEVARRAFEQAGDTASEASALRLLGHIASDLGHPAQGRILVAQALERYGRLGDAAGRAQAEVVLGEIDYLIGDHARARATLNKAVERCTQVGDVLGRAQCLILLALIEEAAGAFQRGRDLLARARVEFDRIGYRLGVAQTDVALGHADHRAFDFASARSRALAARASFREVQNPRGEAACERLLAMVALDSDDFEAAEAHARVAFKIYERLQDPWGELETRLVLAQVALARNEDRAAAMVAACDRAVLDEAEPRQHRHLTRAWLAQRQGRWAEAASELDAARAAFVVPSVESGTARAAEARARTGDHTPHILVRLARLSWSGPAFDKIESWLRQIEAAGGRGLPSSTPPKAVEPPTEVDDDRRAKLGRR